MHDGVPRRSGTVLVTGGSGFLGGRCILQLLEQGYDVRATVRSKSRVPSVDSGLSGALGRPAELDFFVADLGGDAGWDEAVAGCDYVLHVASPFPPSQPKDPQELIGPARDGALRVLRAALAAGVKRVVLTSSTVAVRNGATVPLDVPYTEGNWTDPDLPGLTPYGQSKTIAERAAWDLVKESGDSDRLAVVNPSAILGPVLGEEDSSSLQIIRRMLDGMPGVPRLGFSFVDVRDVADLQIRAMTEPQAGGQRFIASGPFLWLSEVSKILREGLPEEAGKAPTRIVPKPLIRLMGIFDPSIRSVIGDIGKVASFSTEKARTMLGWEPRPIEQTIVDCGRSLAAHES